MMVDTVYCACARCGVVLTKASAIQRDAFFNPDPNAKFYCSFLHWERDNPPAEWTSEAAVPQWACTGELRRRNLPFGSAVIEQKWTRGPLEWEWRVVPLVPDDAPTHGVG